MLRRQFLAGALATPAAMRAAQTQISNVTAEGVVNNPYGLRTGPDGRLYVCEIGNHRVSRIDLKTKRLETVLADQKEPYELQFDPEGNLLFVDMPAHCVRMLNRRSGEVRTIAGTGEPGFSGDGGPATSAQFKQPHSIAFHPDGRLLICDIGNHRIRRVDLKKNQIDTFAGTGEREPTPDGSPIQGTPLNGPRAIDFAGDGTLFLVLREGNVVLRASGGKFFDFAGTGEKGYSGDGGDARLARLSGPKGISCGSGGSVYIADTESHTIRRIDPRGVITTVAGTGERGDGPAGDPLKCKLSRPHGVFAAKDGRVYIGDSESHRVRVVTY
jgi:streptogramin lyase